MSSFIGTGVLFYLIFTAHGFTFAFSGVMESGTRIFSGLHLAIEASKVIEDILNIDSDSNKELVDHEELLKALEIHIDEAKTAILSSIILRSKLDRIDDAFAAIHSSLADLKSVINAKTASGAKELLKLFTDRYEQNDVITHVRFLWILLTYVTPGESVDLITLVRDDARCGATALKTFETFYLNLIDTGAFLEMSFLAANTDHVNITIAYEEWAKVLLETKSTFRNQTSICQGRFPSDVQTDLENSKNASELRDQLDARYPGKIFDIVFYSGIASNQFHAFHYTDKVRDFFWAREPNTINKVLVLTEDIGKPKWNVGSTKAKLEDCIKDNVVDEDNTRAAEDVLTSLFTCEGMTYPLGVVVVYFEGAKFPTKGLITNPHSPVVQLSVEDVTLRHCSTSALACTFGKEEVSGRFRVLVYPNYRDDINETHFTIGRGQGQRGLIWVSMAIALFVT